MRLLDRLLKPTVDRLIAAYIKEELTDLIVGWRERGLDVTRPILAMLDGSKALRRAVVDATRPVRRRAR